MAFQDIIKGIGQFAAAMNPDYQAGVQMAQQEMQRKKLKVLMSSPTMQKAIMSTWGPEVGQLMMGAAGVGPGVFKGFAEMLPPQQPEEPYYPKTAEEAMTRGAIGAPGGIDIPTGTMIKTAGQKPTAPTRRTRQQGRWNITEEWTQEGGWQEVSRGPMDKPFNFDQMWFQYNNARLKGLNSAEAIKEMLGSDPKALAENAWMIKMFENMPELTKDQFVQAIKTGQMPVSELTYNPETDEFE